MNTAFLLPDTPEFFTGLVVLCAFFLFVCFSIIPLYLRNKLKLEKSQEFSRQTLAAIEKERTLISCELHDTIAQDLKITATMSTQEEVQQRIGKTIDDIRTICYAMTPPDIVNSDLASAISFLAASLSEQTGRTILCKPFPHSLRKELNAFSPDDQLHLYRMVQESLNNAIRHAGKSCSISVFATTKGKKRNLFITDSGDGFDVKESENNGGFGLNSLKHRAEVIGVHLEITSEISSGTTVHIWW